MSEVEEYNAGIYIEQDTKNIFEYSTQEDEMENDGYIREDEVQDIEIGKKYNQIQSHKIKNNWDANIRKKEDTMWSHGHGSMEQYIIKSRKASKNNQNNRNNKETEKQENIISSNKQYKTVNKAQQEDTIEKMRKIQEELQARKANNIQKTIEKSKTQKVTEAISKNKKRKSKENVTNEETSRPIRNQILFSEDKIDEE